MNTFQAEITMKNLIVLSKICCRNRTIWLKTSTEINALFLHQLRIYLTLSPNKVNVQFKNQNSRAQHGQRHLNITKNAIGPKSGQKTAENVFTNWIQMAICLLSSSFGTGPDSSVGRVSALGNGRSRVRSRAATYQSR